MKSSTVGLVAVFAGLCVAAPASAEPLLLGYFTGTLACADCAGVRTELTLVRKASGWAEGRYLLKRSFIGRPGKPVIATGDWTTLKGDAADDDAVVYELDPDSPKRPWHFEQQRGGAIRALDADLKALPPKAPAVLTRQSRDLPGPAAVECLRHGGVPGAAASCAKPVKP